MGWIEVWMALCGRIHNTLPLFRKKSSHFNTVKLSEILVFHLHLATCTYSERIYFREEFSSPEMKTVIADACAVYLRSL